MGEGKSAAGSSRSAGRSRSAETAALPGREGARAAKVLRVLPGGRGVRLFRTRAFRLGFEKS
jgi:hypothetical protein